MSITKKSVFGISLGLVFAWLIVIVTVCLSICVGLGYNTVTQSIDLFAGMAIFGSWMGDPLVLFGALLLIALAVGLVVLLVWIARHHFRTIRGIILAITPILVVIIALWLIADRPEVNFGMIWMSVWALGVLFIITVAITLAIRGVLRRTMTVRKTINRPTHNITQP